MDQISKEKSGFSAQILVAPLDWGLGHATRCIPVIYGLIAEGATPVLAGEGLQLELLREEFPNLEFVDIPGYRVRYSRSSKGFTSNIFWQLPRLVASIKTEHKWLKKLVKSRKIDGIIADNRFGLWHSGIPSVFITHQLAIKSGLGSAVNKIIQRTNYNYINRFAECWIPDNKSNSNLAGALAHPDRLPVVPIKYVGPLSRFKTILPDEKEKPGHLLFLISGPEPQRSKLENLFIDAASHYHGSSTLVRGLPGKNNSLLPSTNDIRIYNHLATNELNEEIGKASFVISRSGYSSLMDLTSMRKKMILIPTPGQTEQEYLAEYFEQQHWAVFSSQENFKLNDLLEKARRFSYKFIPEHPSQLNLAIKDLIQKIKISSNNLR